MRNSLVLLALFVSTQALALDQIILKNGTSIVGKIINENSESVEIENRESIRTRYYRQVIDQILKDIVSEKTPPIYALSAMGGISFVAERSAFSPIMLYGARLSRRINGWPPAGVFHVGLSFDRSHQSLAVPTGTQTQDVNDYAVHFMLKEIDRTGAYTGISVGEAVINTNTNVLNLVTSSSIKRLEAGALVGYEFNLSQAFSIAPEFRIGHIFNLKNADIAKALICASIHF